MRVRSEFGADRTPSVYYHPPRRKVLQVDEILSARIKGIIQRYPRYGYRRVHAVLRHLEGWVVNKKKVQRIMQRKGWIVRRRPAGKRPRAQGLPSVVPHPNTLWATDLAHLFCGQVGQGDDSRGGVGGCSDPEIRPATEGAPALDPPER